MFKNYPIEKLNHSQRNHVNNYNNNLINGNTKLVEIKCVIQEMNLSKFFTTIVGARDNIPLKPKPNMLILTMDGFNTTNKMFYIVGDTSNDIDAAKAANIKSIAVAGGYTDKDVNKLGATHTLKSMKDIIKLLGLS